MIVEHVVLVGLGSIGRRHLRNLKQIRPDIKVTLVRSGKGEKWPELELADNVVYSTQEAIRKKPHAAIIASPTSLHVQHALAFAEEGIHVLVEKSLSDIKDGVEKLLEVVEEKKITGLTGYVLRYDPLARTFKKLIESNKIGKILHVRVETGSYLPDWRPDQNYTKSVSASSTDGGVLLELSHELDYIHWFFGDISTIQANLTNTNYLDIDVEDCADILLKTKDKIPISLHMDFHQRHATRFCKISGSKGTALWDAVENAVIWKPINGEPEVNTISYDRDELFKNQLKHYLGCIEQNEKPFVSLYDGYYALNLIDACREANATGVRTILV